MFGQDFGRSRCPLVGVLLAATTTTVARTSTTVAVGFQGHLARRRGGGGSRALKLDRECCRSIGRHRGWWGRDLTGSPAKGDGDFVQGPTGHGEGSALFGGRSPSLVASGCRYFSIESSRGGGNRRSMISWKGHSFGSRRRRRRTARSLGNSRHHHIRRFARRLLQRLRNKALGLILLHFHPRRGGFIITIITTNPISSRSSTAIAVSNEMTSTARNGTLNGGNERLSLLKIGRQVVGQGLANHGLKFRIGIVRHVHHHIVLAGQVMGRKAAAQPGRSMGILLLTAGERTTAVVAVAAMVPRSGRAAAAFGGSGNLEIVQGGGNGQAHKVVQTSHGRGRFQIVGIALLRHAAGLAAATAAAQTATTAGFHHGLGCFRNRIFFFFTFLRRGWSYHRLWWSWRQPLLLG
mmetsp:Transcript_7865/g.16396  ORF Transcript_7865/g.16396 Transcript_7865/m.16396 type:complete len:407 (-) Transcript_7865:634-1854(-)